MIQCETVWSPLFKINNLVPIGCKTMLLCMQVSYNGVTCTFSVSWNNQEKKWCLKQGVLLSWYRMFSERFWLSLRFPQEKMWTSFSICDSVLLEQKESRHNSTDPHISKNMSCILCCWPSSAPFCYAPVSLLLFFHVILLPGFVCIWFCVLSVHWTRKPVLQKLHHRH